MLGISTLLKSNVLEIVVVFGMYLAWLVEMLIVLATHALTKFASEYRYFGSCNKHSLSPPIVDQLRNDLATFVS